MKITSDFHSHIVRSSALQMVQQAKASGLQVQGLSEHVFQMSELRPLLPHLPQEGPFLTLDEYFEQIQAAREESGFDVRIGLEVDFVPELHEQIAAGIQGRPWDFLIGSVHQIGDIQFEEPARRTRAEGEALWQSYFALLRAAVQSGTFSVVSHPVRMRSANAFLPANLNEELEHLAAVAAQHNVALEVNGYDILNYPALVGRLVHACVLHKTPLSVGSDAHTPRGIAQGHQLSESLLTEAGVTHVRIWKAMQAEEYALFPPTNAVEENR